MNKTNRRSVFFMGCFVLLIGWSVLTGTETEIARNKVLSLAEGEYKEGVGSMLELIDARTTHVSAERFYINVLAEYRLAWAKLERSIGVIK
jgi:outer membrane protein TolC